MGAQALQAAKAKTPFISANFEIMRHVSPDEAQIKNLFAALPGGAIHTPFQSPLFLSAFADHMLAGVSGSFCILEVIGRNHSSPVMLVPVMSRQRGPVRIASMLDLSLADQTAPIFSRDLPIEPDQFGELRDLIFAAIPDADIVDFFNMPEKVEGRDNPLALSPDAVAVTSSLILDLADPEAETQWRRKSAFKQVPRKRRKLENAGVEIVEAHTPAERLHVYDTLVEQRRVRFDELGMSNGLNQPDQAAFYRELAARPFPESAAVIIALRCGDEIVAANLFMQSRTILNTVLLSIGDKRWHAMSPGIVLMMAALECAQQRGIEQFSFGTGMQEYKKRFGASRLPMRNLTHPLTVKGRGYKLIRDLKSLMEEQATV
ncbi:GNAT family N-acetyltransferase [Roseibium sp.]|uniref:GNAT family N-acetyltransferase n=1 Tax=Roseibium sp. TaxID=1936156 RepID=UPI003A97F949